MAKSKFQAFETEVISRSQIKNAPYNPRIMDKEAKKRLKQNIKKHGLVSAMTWNKRTGNLVGGHQRLEQLDSLEKSEDYDLTVCVVDVDEAEEAVLNVQLNNPSMQGDWDLDKLADISAEFDLDMKEDFGFTDLDVEFMFEGDDRFSEMFHTKETEDVRQGLEQVKEARKKSAEKIKEANSISWYEIIIFQNEEDRKKFLNSISVPVSEMYITTEQLSRLSRNNS